MLTFGTNTGPSLWLNKKITAALFISALFSAGKVVACDGIEPPTRGFSIISPAFTLNTLGFPRSVASARFMQAFSFRRSIEYSPNCPQHHLFSPSLEQIRSKNMRLTKKTILDLMADPESHGKQYYDDGQAGLSIYVGKKSATFYYQGWLPSGKRTRVKLGRFPVLTVSQAREKALCQARTINEGVDPNKERRLGRHGDSLGQITEDYIETRKLKASTSKEYRAVIEMLGANQKERNYRDIDEDEIISLFIKITKTRGEAPANKAGRVLRAVLGHTYAVREKRIYNPAQILTLRKMWHKVLPKKRVIPARSLGSYLLAIDFARETAGKRVTQNICDYAEFTLLTAYRLNESSNLEWRNVDLDNGTVFLEDPKNRVAILQPMPAEAWEILKRRNTQRVSDWVFDGRPSDSGHVGPLNNPNKTLQRIANWAGLEKITSHDLRRTATSIAESLGITDRRLKRMLNHSSGDVTGDYVSPYFDPESLRTSFQLVADFLYLKKAEAEEAGWKPAGVIV